MYKQLYHIIFEVCRSLLFIPRIFQQSAYLENSISFYACFSHTSSLCVIIVSVLQSLEKQMYNDFPSVRR